MVVRVFVLGRIARRMCQLPTPSWVPAEVQNNHILNLPLGECVIPVAGALGATRAVSPVGGGQDGTWKQCKMDGISAGAIMCLTSALCTSFMQSHCIESLGHPSLCS